MSRRAARCTKADIRRALEAAEAAGVDVAVDILTDGTIRLLPAKPIALVAPTDSAQGKPGNPWDE